MKNRLLFVGVNKKKMDGKFSIITVLQLTVFAVMMMVKKFSQQIQ